MDKRKVVILFGPPGAGKGASGQRLAEKTNFYLISLGDLVREEVKKSSDLGKKFGELINNGKFIRNEDILLVLKNKLSELKEKNRGIILDGYPRNIEQAKALEKLNLGKSIVINLVLPGQEIVKRLGQRRTCLKCKRVYNLLTIPPKVAGRCDFDGAELIQREDDAAEVIKKRLQIYRKETEPLVEFYTERGIIFDVSTKPPVEDVVEEILDVLEDNF